MSTGQYARTVLSVALSGLVVGCAQPGPMLSRRTTLGSLKTSLSHIEFENQQLRTKVSKLESDNREIEDRLVQEEEANGDLSARLDDARHLLSREGFDGGERGIGAVNRDDPSGNEPPSRTLPAGRSNRKPRKPPFARIPGRVDSAPPADNTDDEFTRPTVPGADSIGPQSRLDDDTRWLPIARGGNPTPSKVR